MDEWTAWSACDKTCWNTQSYNSPSPRRTRNREKIRNEIGDGLCLHTKEAETCEDIPNCPIDGVWAEWVINQTCSNNKLCGKGIETYSRKCNGPFHGGENCAGESEKTEPCELDQCLCEFSPWSEWSDCDSNNGHGCGYGTRTRSRNISKDDTKCYFKPGELLKEHDQCFTKHCTKEFYQLHSIEIMVGESMYPGNSKEWELIVSANNSVKFNCTTSGISYLRSGKRIISGNDLGECSSVSKTVITKAFLEMETLDIQIMPKERHDIVVLDKLGIHLCDYDKTSKSRSEWQFDIQGHACNGYTKGRNGIIQLDGESGCRFDNWTRQFMLTYSTVDKQNKINVSHFTTQYSKEILHHLCIY